MAKRCLKLTQRLEEISRNKGWWFFGENRSGKKKCVDIFYHRKKKVKKTKCWFIPQNTIGPFCVFTQTTTPNWGNQLLGRILTSWKNLYDILQIFFAQKEGIFASWKRPKKLLFCKLSFTFVIFYHFINLYQNLCYQSASLSLFIVFKTSFINFIISKWKTLISTLITISFYQTGSWLSTWDQISVWINFAHLWMRDMVTVRDCS